MVHPSFQRWAEGKTNRLGKLDSGEARTIIPLEGPEPDMPSGAIYAWRLESEPMPEDGMNLFVIAAVRVRDRVENFRSSFAARKYLPGERRFVVVPDPDYEGHD